jgi:phage gpG-like protein
MFEKLVKELRDVEKLQFDSEGGYGSGGWTPLAISTIESKQRREVDNGVLRATDLLYNSLTGTGSGSIAEISSEWLRYGTTVFYAGIHQAGAESTHLPQRRVVQLPEGERRNIAKLVQEYIVTGKFA